MLDFDKLRREHQAIMVRATNLRGLGDRIQTRDDAGEARGAIVRLNTVLVEHLRFEDDYVYPALMSCGVAAVAALASDCAEEMSGILGAWIAYRDRWTAVAIQAEPERFSLATAGMIGALAMRVERENTELFPAADGLALVPIGDGCVAE